MLQKNKIPDPRIIKMSYLDFLFSIMSNEPQWYNLLHNLLTLTLQEQEFSFMYSQYGNIFIKINSETIDGNDFENIRKIILKQNFVPVDEDLYESEIEQALREAEEFVANKGGKQATLEERIIALHCLSGRSFNEIKEYTIYQFNKILERFAIIKNYEVFSPLIAQYGKSEDIQHWLCHIEEKSKYADVIMSKEEFDKITSDNDIFNKA
jgi:hypothetical protein